MSTVPQLRLLTDAGAAFPFQGMTFPFYRRLLHDHGPETGTVAVGASLAEGPVGLALAEIDVAEQLGHIRSLFVSVPARRQGIGTHLLARLEDELSRRGALRGSFVFARGNDLSTIAEPFLRSCGWSDPRPRMLLFTAGAPSVDRLLQAPWMNKLTIPPGCTLFAWDQLTEWDRQSIAAGQNAGAFPEILSPFAAQEPIELKYSLGLRYQGELAGWMITHRPDALTVRYTALWVRPDLPVKGVGIRMLVEALRRHIAAERQIPGAQACFGTFPDFRLAGFIERRLLPFLPDAKVRTTMESEKDLTEII